MEGLSLQLVFTTSPINTFHLQVDYLATKLGLFFFCLQDLLILDLLKEQQELKVSFVNVTDLQTKLTHLQDAERLGENH